MSENEKKVPTVVVKRLPRYYRYLGELLKQDIEERGVRVLYDNGGGQKGIKKNDSVEQLVKIKAQMLKLLSELNIKPSNDLIGDDEDEL